MTKSRHQQLKREMRAGARRQRLLRKATVCALVVGIAVFAASDVKRWYCPMSLEDMLVAPESRIDYGRAALELTRTYVPGYDVRAGLAALDEIAARVRALLAKQPDTADPKTQIAAINTVLYREYGFHFDQSDMTARRRDNHFLGTALTGRAGSCANLPDLYYAVAERLDLPIYLVEGVHHAFLRYELPDGDHINIEATSGGSSFDDDVFILENEVPETARRSGWMMRSLSRREALSLLLGEDLWGMQNLANRDLDAEARVAEQLTQLRPESGGNWWNRALVSFGLAKRRLMDNPARGRKHLEDAQRFALKAKELGTPPPERDDYAQRIAEIRRRRELEGAAATALPALAWDPVEVMTSLTANVLRGPDDALAQLQEHQQQARLNAAILRDDDDNRAGFEGAPQGGRLPSAMAPRVGLPVIEQTGWMVESNHSSPLEEVEFVKSLLSGERAANPMPAARSGDVVRRAGGRP